MAPSTERPSLMLSLIHIYRADRLAAGSVILRGIGVPVEAALDKLRRVLKVLAQIVFGDVEDLRFDLSLIHICFFRVKLYAVPHFQVEGMDVNLSLVSQMPKAKA